jgi:uncharacterized protein (DUF2164 family)
MVAILILFAEVLVCAVMITPTAINLIKPNNYLRLSFDGGSRGVNALGSGGAILHLCLAGISAENEQSAAICANINSDKRESSTQSRTEMNKEAVLSDAFKKRDLSRFSNDYRTTRSVITSDVSTSTSSDIDSYQELELWRGSFFFGDGISSHLAEYMSLIEGLHAYRNLVHSKDTILFLNRSQSGRAEREERGGDRGNRGGGKGERGRLRNEKENTDSVIVRDSQKSSNNNNINKFTNTGPNNENSMIGNRRNMENNLLYIQGDSEIVINNLLREYLPKNQLLRAAHITASTLLKSISNQHGIERELFDSDEVGKRVASTFNNYISNENCDESDGRNKTDIEDKNENKNEHKYENQIEFNSDRNKMNQSRSDLGPSDSTISTSSDTEKNYSDFDCFDVRTDGYVLHHVYREYNVHADKLSTYGVEKKKSFSVYNREVFHELSAVKNYSYLQGKYNLIDYVDDEARVKRNRSGNKIENNDDDKYDNDNNNNSNNKNYVNNNNNDEINKNNKLSISENIPGSKVRKQHMGGILFVKLLTDKIPKYLRSTFEQSEMVIKINDFSLTVPVEFITEKTGQKTFLGGKTFLKKIQNSNIIKMEKTVKNQNSKNVDFDSNIINQLICVDDLKTESEVKNTVITLNLQKKSKNSVNETKTDSDTFLKNNTKTKQNNQISKIVILYDGIHFRIKNQKYDLNEKIARIANQEVKTEIENLHDIKNWEDVKHKIWHLAVSLRLPVKSTPLSDTTEDGQELNIVKKEFEDRNKYVNNNENDDENEFCSENDEDNDENLELEVLVSYFPIVESKVQGPGNQGRISDSNLPSDTNTLSNITSSSSSLPPSPSSLSSTAPPPPPLLLPSLLPSPPSAPSPNSLLSPFLTKCRTSCSTDNSFMVRTSCSTDNSFMVRTSCSTDNSFMVRTSCSTDNSFMVRMYVHLYINVSLRNANCPISI